MFRVEKGLKVEKRVEGFKKIFLDIKIMTSGKN